MKTSILRYGLLAAGVLFASACAIEGNAQFNGSGSFNSAGGAGRAILAINGDTCNGNENPNGQVLLLDESAIDFEDVGGVKIRADILEAGICSSSTVPGGTIDNAKCLCGGLPAVYGEYVSTNPAAPGTGRLRGCFVAAEDQPSAGVRDIKSTLITDITLLDGPYAGYQNHGTMVGSIKVSDCPTVDAG